MPNKRKIPFVNLKKAHKNIAKDIEKTTKKIFRKGVFILGEQVSLFEKEFASYLNVPYAIGVASGTDAITLALKALNIQKGQEVLLPVNSYPTAFAVAASGARLRLLDVHPNTFTMHPEKIESSITSSTKAIMVVHLYGQPAHLEPILKIAKKHKLYVIEDAAQAHGASYKGKKVGTFGDIGCFSFYPTKNLGAYGDGGMVVTHNKRIAAIVRELRMYGERKRYDSKRLGINSRLDELQAGILRVKLKKLDFYNSMRRKVAKQYIDGLSETGLFMPPYAKDLGHVYYLFVVRTKRRKKLMEFLAKNGVETAIHFPLLIHQVFAFKHLGYKKGDFPNAEEVSSEILSLPCYPELTGGDVTYVSRLVKKFLTV